MGRVLRRVPPDWEHPRDDEGEFQPLYDVDYPTAAAMYTERFLAWEAGQDPERDDTEHRYFWEVYGPPPYSGSVRMRAWTPEEATAYQVYENVTRGTPVSPVFTERDALRDWLIAQGHSARAVDLFLKIGSAPSAVIGVQPGPRDPSYVVKQNIDCFDILPDPEDVSSWHELQDASAPDRPWKGVFNV